MASACGPGGSLVTAWVTGCSSIITVEPRGRPISRTPPLSIGPTTSAEAGPRAGALLGEESVDGVAGGEPSLPAGVGAPGRALSLWDDPCEIEESARTSESLCCGTDFTTVSATL